MLGRGKELAALEQLLDRARSGSAGANVFSGPPGIGKTTLLAAAWDQAADFDRVRIAGLEAEADLAWAGLASLLLAWPALDGAPRDALRAVVEGDRRNMLAVGSALHAGIVSQSERAPVLLVIDDAQWLDSPSAEALAFAANRLAADRVAVVVAQRSGSASRFARATQLDLDGLDAAPCRALVRSRWSLPAQVVERCIALTGGNPLALLHVCDALTPDQQSGLRPIAAADALPQRLGDVFAARLAELPAATARALAVLAAGAEGERFADALAAVDAKVEDFAAAEAAGIVAIEGRPRLVHPLWGAAVLEHAGAALRRRVHRALAEHTRDPDRAAWHRAAGAEHADEHVARELEALALRSAERGLPALAARAWSEAAALSETDPARRTREIAAARAFWDASMPGAAAALLDGAIDALTDPAERAGAVLLRNRVRAFTEDARGAALALRAEADRIEAAHPELAFPLLAAGPPAALLAADAPLGLALASRAADVAPDEPSRAIACALRGYAAVHLGDGSAADAIRSMEALGALSLDGAADDTIELLQLAGYVLLVRERWDDAERTLRAVIAAAARRGLASIEAFSGALLAELDFRRGRWLDALTEATVDIALNETRDESRATLGHAVAAHVLAHLGDAEQCAQRADHALRSAGQLGLWSIAAFAHGALGASALARGDTADAAEQLGAVWEIRLRGGVAEAGVVWYQGDFVEALLAEGRRSDAEAIVREVARNAEATRGAWATAVATRGHALLGGGPPADAIAAATALGAPFELARTRLALVEHGRLDRVAAGIDAALATFERLGARPWAARARALSGAPGEPAPSLAQQLTDAELRVAMIVGRGATNAAAGEQLVISVRTVDAHLRSIFRKLGLKSRSELVLRVANEAGRR